MLIGLIIIGVVAGGFLFFFLYTKGDHWSPKNGKGLSYDADIVSCDTKPFIGNKNKSTVVFSDGFKLVSYKSIKVSKEFNRMTAVGPRYTNVNMVTSGMRDELIQKATEIHDALIAAQTGLTVDYDKWKCIHCGTINSKIITKCAKCGEKKLDYHNGQKVIVELKKS